MAPNLRGRLAFGRSDFHLHLPVSLQGNVTVAWQSEAFVSFTIWPQVFFHTQVFIFVSCSCCCCCHSVLGFRPSRSQWIRKTVTDCVDSKETLLQWQLCRGFWSWLGVWPCLLNRPVWPGSEELMSLLIKAWAPCHQHIWWSELVITTPLAAMLTLGCLGFHLSCACVCMGLCVCVTEEEVKKDQPIKNNWD